MFFTGVKQKWNERETERKAVSMSFSWERGGIMDLFDIRPPSDDLSKEGRALTVTNSSYFWLALIG